MSLYRTGSYLPPLDAPVYVLVGWVIAQELLDEVDVGHDHAATTVAVEA
jgi:hypothetical protein